MIQQRTPVTTIQAATTITAAETAIGSIIDVSNYNTLTVFVKYVKGDETSYDIIAKARHAIAGTEYPSCSWSPGSGTKTVTADIFRMTANGSHYIQLDVRGIKFITLYGDATGGTPDGTAALDYTLCTE